MPRLVSTYSLIKSGQIKVRWNSPSSHRFWLRINKEGAPCETLGRCWAWVGEKCGGYGHLTIEGKKIKAHRYSWSIHYGEIPDGLQVLHRCDNPQCCRPDHLFLGT